jgi:RNA polymerase sigma factor (sigma-70 family)
MAAVQLGAVLRRLRLVAERTGEDQSDRQLLDHFVATRDEAAFAALLQRHGRLVFGVCCSVLHQEQDAEDAFQATFLVLARMASSIRKLDSLASWLHGVALRTALRARQTMKTRRRYEQKSGPRTPEQPVSEAALRELQAILHEEVGQLADKYRAPFVLCCLEGKTRAEAARELGWKEGTVSSRIAQARTLLSSRLVRRGVALPAALAAAAIVPAASSAAVPITLFSIVVRAAPAFAVRNAAEAVSVKVAALAEGVIKAMLITKLKVVTSAVLFLGLVLGGSGLWACSALPSQEGEPALVAPLAQAAEAQDRKPKENAEKPAQDRLLGKWTVTSVKGDRAINLDQDWRAQVECVRFCAASKFGRVDVPSSVIIELKDGRILTLAYSVDVAAKPPTIDLSPPRDEENDGSYHGIYQIDGDNLKVCLSRPGRKRPEAFEAKEGFHRVLLVLKRDAAGDAWHSFMKNSLVAVDIERCLYEVKDQRRFLMAVRLTNLTKVEIGVDWQPRVHSLYPNQWSVTDTDQRGIIGERRTAHAPPDKDKVRAEFKAGRLTRIPAGKSTLVYAEFDNRGRADVDRKEGKFFIVSMDGQFCATDGKAVETITCAWTQGRTSRETDVVLPFPVTWKQATVGEKAENKAAPPGEKKKAEKPAEIEWGPEKNGVRCAVEVSKEKIFAGEPVHVRFATKNDGPKPVSILVEAPSYFAIFTINVLGPDGKPAPLTSVGHNQKEALGGSFGGGTLLPGKVDTSGMLLSRCFDMTRPGEYKVSVTRSITAADNTKFSVPSNVLTIKVWGEKAEYIPGDSPKEKVEKLPLPGGNAPLAELAKKCKGALVATLLEFGEPDIGPPGAADYSSRWKVEQVLRGTYAGTIQLSFRLQNLPEQSRERLPAVGKSYILVTFESNADQVAVMLDTNQDNKRKIGELLKAALEWGPEKNGVRCAASLATSEKAFAGEPVHVQFLTKNVGAKPVTIVREGRTLSVFTINVVRPDGKPAPLTAYGRQLKDRELGSRAAIKLAPSEVDDTTRLLLSRIYDMTPTGDYKVSFSRVWVEGADGPAFSVTSNVLTVTIAGERGEYVPN